MKMPRRLLAFLLVVGLAGVAQVAQQAEPSGGKMAAAATKFLDSLTADQKAKCTFPVDSPERRNWLFTPQQDKERKYTRKGLPLEEMNDAQRQAAMALVQAATSPSGYKKVETIMSLESLLRELEKNGAMVRNPGWYFFTVFGDPSKTGRWGWRVEGHHLSLNFLMDGGRVVSATPAFFGANPATVKDGGRKGLRTLPEAEDLARDLFKSLDDSQKQTAMQEKQHPEIQEKTDAPKVGGPQGLAAAKMTPPQRQTLLRLLESYAGRLADDIAHSEMANVEKAGLDQVHFSYYGGTEPGKPYTYRIHGPTVVIEFLNVQADSARNPANHIHSSWRYLKGDFGAAQ